MQTELKMQDVFDLNTTIDRLKYSLEQDYNFVSNSSQLQTNITLFARNDAFDLDVQQKYSALNDTFKEAVRHLISELETKRDNMMLQIMSKTNEVE